MSTHRSITGKDAVHFGHGPADNIQVMIFDAAHPLLAVVYGACGQIDDLVKASTKPTCIEGVLAVKWEEADRLVADLQRARDELQQHVEALVGQWNQLMTYERFRLKNTLFRLSWYPHAGTVAGLFGVRWSFSISLNDVARSSSGLSMAMRSILDPNCTP